MNRKTQLTLGRQNDEKFLPSTIPGTQEDVRQLEECFNKMLYNEYALENGLCPKRRRIYNDLFSELVRITKVHCNERGILLERIQQEYIQWMKTYEELYSSSMGYSIRQYLYKLEEKNDFESRINQLEYDCQQLRNELQSETNKYENLTKKMTQEQRRQISDIKFLKSINKKLRNDIEKILNEILSSSIFLGEPINYK